MNKTRIEWVKNPDDTPGYTWNPISGCLNGCEYCYARKLANTRLKERYLANPNIAPVSYPLPDIPASLQPFYPRFWEDRLSRLVQIKRGGKVKPRGIFVCDMSDLFGIGIPENWTARVLEIIKGNWQDRFYLLTKQPQNLQKFSPFPDNCFVGVSATGNEAYHKAIDILSEIDAKVKYLSLEPLLGRIEIDAYLINATDWIIIGGQTKPTVIPKIEWVKEIVEAADGYGIPVFIKNNLAAYARNLSLYPKMRVGDDGWDAVRQEMPTTNV